MAKSDNEAREQRILDAAANLFVHYGYDKTTVDDIAREAGVSKGAIYLHFKSKDELFEGLLIREMVAYSEDWYRLLEADPNGGTLGGMYKNMLRALNHSPFMAAMFKQDRRVFGTYLRKPDNFFQRLQAGQAQSPRYEFVRLMQAAGALRQDIDARIIAHIMNMLAYGLVGMDDIMPEDDIPPLEEVIEGIAILMDRALTLDDSASRDVGKAIVRQIMDATREKFEAAMNPAQEQK